jgi:hypothetical protein
LGGEARRMEEREKKCRRRKRGREKGTRVDK